MDDVYPIFKPIGKTPLEIVKEFKNSNPQMANKTVSYAGRLDPMADGLLLLLVGKANRQRIAFEKLDKTYTFSVLFGIATDSYDLLGIPKLVYPHVLDHKHHASLYRYIQTHIGTFEQQFPPFSSKTLHGKPLYYWARKGKLASQDLPSKMVTVHDFVLVKRETIGLLSLFNMIKRNIGSVRGDFRQQEILEAWEKLFMSCNKSTRFSECSFYLTCSSGTYVRSIADDLGRTLRTGAVVTHIRRTRIGAYRLENAKI